jgi:hypothetical protein
MGKIFAPYAVRLSDDLKINPMGTFGMIYFVVGFLPMLFLSKTNSNLSPEASKDTSTIE